MCAASDDWREEPAEPLGSYCAAFSGKFRTVAESAVKIKGGEKSAYPISN